MAQELLLKLAVDAPLLSALTYRAPELYPRGTSLHVPLGKRKARAVVLGPAAEAGNYVLKDTSSTDDTRPQIPDTHLRFLEWLSDYYIHPIGQVVALAFPPLDTKDSKRKSKRAPVVKISTESNKPPTLTDEQRTAVSAIADKSGFHTHLVFGVTGSGKTEVYLHALEKVLARGQKGLVLVPEISLTPQLIGRFAARFGDSVAVLHSQLTDRERTTQWWSIISGEKKILIGARSALFCPMENLGLIIVDEEHEPSYKQDEKLKYNGRDAAIVLAKLHNVPIVLGSATPSLESWSNALSGKYHLHRMSSRVGGRALPTVDIVDMRESRRKKKEAGESDLPHWMTPELFEKTTEALGRKEQAAFFLNRRGIAQTVLCSDCGYTYRCPNCEISLTLHGKSHLVCHYCDYSASTSPTCPSCKEGEPKPLGIGTEQIEDDLKKLFPAVRVARADRDEIQSRESLEELITDMEERRIDLLVGTQMIAKGLDFTHLTVVGLVLADVGFNLPDFRSTERSFQLVTQVSGRAGRHILSGGNVVIQTYNPEHLSLQFAKSADFEGFAKEELMAREHLHYPPYGKLCAFRISGPDQMKTEKAAEHLADRARLLSAKNPLYAEIKVLGPAVAPLSKIRGKYRYHVLLKAIRPSVLSPFSRQLLGDESWIPAATKVQVDIDPLHLL